jgi:hypothetical protein
MKEHWFGPDGIFGTHPTRLRLTDEERAKNAEPLPPVTVETPQRFTDVEQIHPGSVFRPDPNFLADSPMSENVKTGAATLATTATKRRCPRTPHGSQN